MIELLMQFKRQLTQASWDLPNLETLCFPHSQWIAPFLPVARQCMAYWEAFAQLSPKNFAGTSMKRIKVMWLQAL